MLKTTINAGDGKVKKRRPSGSRLLRHLGNGRWPNLAAGYSVEFRGNLWSQLLTNATSDWRRGKSRRWTCGPTSQQHLSLSVTRVGPERHRTPANLFWWRGFGCHGLSIHFIINKVAIANILHWFFFYFFPLGFGLGLGVDDEDESTWKIEWKIEDSHYHKKETIWKKKNVRSHF